MTIPIHAYLLLLQPAEMLLNLLGPVNPSLFPEYLLHVARHETWKVNEIIIKSPVLQAFWIQNE